MCVSRCGIPGARVHEHVCVGAPDRPGVWVWARTSGEAWFQPVTSQLSFLSLFLSGGPWQIKFSLHCFFSVCFWRLPISEPLQTPEGEREGSERKGGWRLGVGRSPRAICASWGHQPWVCPPSAACTAQTGLCPGCGKALPPLPEEMRPRLGGEGEAHLG